MVFPTLPLLWQISGLDDRHMGHNYGDAFCLHSRFLDQQTLSFFTSSGGTNTCPTFHYQDGAALPGMGLGLWLQPYFWGHRGTNLLFSVDVLNVHCN